MLPASRPEELRYYRLAYDRDPIVARAINMHTEIPLSKMVLDRPKCGDEGFADYVLDWFQGLVNRTKMFPTLIDMVREYWTIGEAFIFVEEEAEIKPSPMAVGKRLGGAARDRGRSHSTRPKVPTWPGRPTAS